jgi:uncharacterized protein YjdB
MSRINPKDKFIYFSPNTATKMKDGVKVPVEKQPFTDPDCGCGIDCCKGYLVLPNYNSVSGDVEGNYAVYIVNGALEIGLQSEIDAIIKGYHSNKLISATSASITGCLSSTPLVALATRQLTAKVLPTGSVQTGVWTTSAPLIATVSSTGLVTAVATGTATITFTSTDGGYTATCAIIVPA